MPPVSQDIPGPTGTSIFANPINRISPPPCTLTGAPIDVTAIGPLTVALTFSNADRITSITSIVVGVPAVATYANRGCWSCQPRALPGATGQPVPVILLSDRYTVTVPV